MKKVSILTLISITSMLTGMAVQVVIAMHLGAGLERDSLFVAMSVPVFMNTLLVSTIGVVITPAILSHNSLAGQRRLLMRSMTYIALGTLFLGGAIFVFRLPFVELLAPGFDHVNRLLTANLLAVAVIIMPVQAASSLLSGYLVAREWILIPNLALTAGNAAALICLLLLGHAQSAIGVILTMLGSAVVVLIIQAAMLQLRNERQIAPVGVAAAGANSVGFYRQAWPLLFSGFVSRSIPLVERNLASSMGVGTISCLGYAGYMISFLVNATTGPTATAYYSRMCTLWNEGKRERVGLILEKNLMMVMTVSLMGAGLFVVVGAEILHVFLLNTKFQTLNGMEFMSYSQILMIAYVFLTCGTLLSRLFYVAGSSKQMALLDCLGTGVYIVAAFFLAHGFNGRGLAAAVSLHSVFITSLFFFWAQRQFKGRMRGKLLRNVAGIGWKWLLIFVAAMCLKLLIQPKVSPLLSTGVGGLFYVVGALFAVRSVWDQLGVRWKEDGPAE